MVVTKFAGRLGNELFIYAFIYACAKRLGTCYAVDSKDMVLHRYFTMGSPSWHLRNRLRLFWYYRITSKLRSFRHVNEEGQQPVSYTDHTYYHGFFQTDAYYKPVQDSFFRTLEIKKELREDFARKFGFTQQPYVAIHYRSGDYTEFGSEDLGGKNLVLPASYFRNAEDALRPEFSAMPFYVVTDSPEDARKVFPGEKYTIVSNSLIEDFQLLQHASALILSNSSFSWWAAQLGRHIGQVIAPRYWLGFKVQRTFPPHIITDNWTLVE